MINPFRYKNLKSFRDKESLDLSAAKRTRFIWFVMEWKRAASMLPILFIRMLIFAVVGILAVGIIIFGVARILGRDNAKKAMVRIGYVAQEDMLTNLAVTYVEQLESVKSWCRLEKTTVDKGMELLEGGELTALLVLPDNLVDEILTGSNAPVTVYLPDTVDASVTNSKIFEELANAGVGMLQTAQAEIYAAEKFAAEMGSAGTYHVEGQLQALYHDINRFNLSAAMNREHLWKYTSLSVTGNHTYAVYYGSAFLALYLLVSGLFLGRFCKRDRRQQHIAVCRLGVPYAWQLASHLFTVVLLMALLGALPFLTLLYPPFAEQLSVVLTTKTVVVVLLSVVLAAAYVLLVYQLVGEYQRAVLVLGFLALVQGYVSGCIVPSVLLPQGIGMVGELVPAAYMKAAFTMLFTGSTQKFTEIALGLLGWSGICFVFTWLAMCLPERNDFIQNKEKTSSVFEKGALKVESTMESKGSLCTLNPIFNILLKRLIHQKSLWVCLSLVVVLSAAAVYMENGTETSIVAAVYDADGRMGDVLTKYNGLVQFVLCDSEEQVKQMVLRDNVECGYILPEGILDDIVQRKANRSIVVYEDGDAVAARVVDEVLFQRLFHSASLQWFEGYIIERLGSETVRVVDIRDTVEEQISQDKTFDIQIERLGEEKAPPTIPTRLLIVGGILLCGLQGLAQALVDWRKNRFYKYNRGAIVLITVLQPVILGILAGIAALAVVRLLFTPTPK